MVTPLNLSRHTTGRQSTDIHIGGRLRTRRLEQAIGQDTLAAMTGISLERIEDYELGDLRITPEDLIALTKSLDVGVSFFFRNL